MATEIKLWQIKEGKLVPSDISMVDSGRRETDDLERWIKNSPEVLGNDVIIIGEQIMTKRGPLDFLGIDKSGNLIVIELKRDKLHREVLAQAIDYASNIATWDAEKIDNECEKYTGKTILDLLGENFDLDEETLEEISVNNTQKILLVGTGVDESLERMIGWLSDNYDVGINVLLLTYTKTSNGDEILARTTIIPEEVEQEKSHRHQKKIHAERHILRKEFWTQLLEKINQRSNIFSRISPNIYSWIGTGAGKSGISYNFVINNKWGDAEIYFDAGKDSKELNKERFDKLFEHKREIEEKMGQGLIWERLDHRRACRISIKSDAGNLRDKESWDRIQEIMINLMLKLIDATKEYVRSLN